MTEQDFPASELATIHRQASADLGILGEVQFANFGPDKMDCRRGPTLNKESNEDMYNGRSAN